MGVPIEQLVGTGDAQCQLSPLEVAVRQCHLAYGEIDCRAITSSAEAQRVVRQYQGLNIAGEVVGTAHMLEKVVGLVNPAVVIEDFILDADKAQSFRGDRSALTPVRLISSLGFGMYWENIQSTLIIQNRTDPKRICTDERLKIWGLYDRNSGPHARDAVRHAFHFLRTCSGNTLKAREKRWVAWPHLFSDPHSERKTIPRQKVRGERILGLG